MSFNPDVKGRVAIITGASRGIGRQCALELAARGCNIVIAAKSDTPQPTLPGTIYTVAEECKKLGVGALPIRVDVRVEKDVENCIDTTMKTFGRIDILINNASALWWQDIVDTPMNRYDLINQVNARGTFMMTQKCLPHMSKAGYGHIINMSPPLTTRGAGGHGAYYISKFGMTIVALAVGEEYKGKGIAANALWPRTVVESLASENFEMGTRDVWRKATILTDSVLGILTEDRNTFTGNMLIDEEYLRSRGVTDFKKYRCNPDVEPPSMEDLEAFGKDAFKRGKATKQKKTSKL
mmetsp:Transcript_15265/g.24804  ORF Transcript_15265/g.24804 Transcript_15265/m.24804 type:complete len:295 (+) Transcript_15265:1898-2782(+)